MTSHETIFMQSGHAAAATELKAALTGLGITVTGIKLDTLQQVYSEPGKPLKYIPASSVSYDADDAAPLIPMIMAIEEKHLDDKKTSTGVGPTVRKPSSHTGG